MGSTHPASPDIPQNESGSPSLTTQPASVPRISSSPTPIRSSRPRLLLNGEVSQDVFAASPVDADDKSHRSPNSPSSPTDPYQTLAKHTRSFSGSRPVSDALEDPFGHSIAKLEKAIDRLDMIGEGVELVGNVLSVVPLLEMGGGIIQCLRQMLAVAQKVMENKLDTLGLVSDSITIVEAVKGRIRASATPPSEDVQAGIQALFAKLTSNTDLLEKFVGRSKFKLFLYASKMQRQIDDARNDTLMYIARFTLESIVSLDQLQKAAEIQRRHDRKEFAKRLNQFIRNPETARHLIENEEVPEVLVTLQREVERQYHTRYFSPVSTQPSTAQVQFPTPHPYHPPTGTNTRVGGAKKNALQLADTYDFFDEDHQEELALSRQPTWEAHTPPPPARRAWHTTLDELDIETSKGEFCHSFLKYLRSESQKGVEDLPVWTITEYEIYREQRECTSNFAKVWRGKWHDQEVAIKDLDPLTDRYLFLAEVNIWCRLNSKFVLPFYGASSAVGPPPWFLVSPWMKNGRITDYVRSEIGRDVNRISLLHQIAQGMEYLHSRDVVHGDIKGQNILIDDEGRPRLCDFGLSQIKIDITNKSVIPPAEGGSAAGTLRFQSPERLQLNPLTKECDVYSFAMTIYQIYSGEIPFAALDTYNAKMSILEGIRPPQLSDIPDQLYQLMTRCWAADPQARPTFEEISEELGTMYDPPYSPPRSTRSVPALLDLAEVESVRSRPPTRLALPIETLAFDDDNGPEVWFTPPLMAAKSDDEGDTAPTDPVLSDEAEEISLINEIDTAVYIPSQSGHEGPTDADLERLYRRHFNYHNYPDRLNLPQWVPSIVSLGDIGYMKEGQFVLLEHGFDNLTAFGMIGSVFSKPRTIPITQSTVYPTLITDKAKDYGVRIVSAFRSKKKSVTKSVRRQVIVPMSPGKKAVRLIVADGKIQMMRHYEFRGYFIAQADTILARAAEEGHEGLQKTDLVAVVGTMTAENYAMAVSDYAPDTTITFNIISPAVKSASEPWGFWTIARDRGSDESSMIPESSTDLGLKPSPSDSVIGGTVPPSPPALPVMLKRLPGVDDQPLRYSAKTSSPDGPALAVHLSVLRFPPTGGEPTFFRDQS
ncbi:uncharacterized protein I303_107879 [Kwoniella dejecticola CBS 10117]|uniref:TKL/TKL-CCIN protein kinase n=1 Tax=Kwoniella dejecticola CBS 10117 TaxID=1296121 RepID=A0A1A5ZVY8_9TREE|nr:TKL/TKL-CCIN protein kinase [Kwoniella dejecticola CBS 10117]OBR81969.1 TKL/TKL-CCIN protein kinase [Kwoniella dejecticola CBS 10117]